MVHELEGEANVDAFFIARLQMHANMTVGTVNFELPSRQAFRG